MFQCCKSKASARLVWIPRIRFLRTPLSLMRCNALVLGLVTSLLAGCFGVIPTRNPILGIPLNGVVSDHRLVVFLPGRGDVAGDFRRKGLLEAFRDVDANTDVIAVQAHMGYYLKREVVDRVYHDILQPAIAAGKTDITLVGISLGGLGALLIEREHPGLIVRRVLIAPYVGDEKLAGEIHDAGGVDQWQPGEFSPEREPFRDLWRWIKQQPSIGEIETTWVLLGTEDRYRRGQELLASQLPPEQTLRQNGEHNWLAWRSLWQVWLQRHWVREANAKVPLGVKPVSFHHRDS